MAIITTPAAGVSPYQEAAATPVVLKADANGNTVLANPTVTATAADTAATTAANANSTVIVNGQAALNQLIASSRSGVFEGANVTINLEEQNFNTTNQVTSNTNYPSGGTGEIQYNSGSNSFASSAYFTYTNGNVITPGIRTDGSYYANGAAFSGGGGNADLGNWAFTANTQYNLNGGLINNSDLSHGSTAGLAIPANGNSVTPVQLINTYGNITLGTGPSSVITKTWTFASNGNTAMPGNISASGNVTGNYFIGNGSQLTGISSSIISNGTSNVSIATSGGPVSVKAGSANAWVFGTDAVLTAPNGSQIVPAGNNFNIYTNGVNGAVQFFTDVTGNNHNWAFDGYGYTNLPFSQGYSNTAVITTVGAGNIMLQAGAGPTQNFVFDTDGALNLTNNGVIRQSGPVNVVATDYAQLQWVDSGNINIPDPNGSGGPLNWAYVESGGFYVETNVNSNAGVSHQLYFNNDGNLQIDYGKLNIFANVSYFGSNAALISPEAGQSMITQALGNTAVASMIWVENVGNALAGNVAAVYANPLPDSGILRFTTGSPSGSQYIWDLDIQGRTLPPLMYTQRGDNPSGTIYGYTLKIGNGGQEAVITTPDGDADGNPNSQRLVINPGKGADTTYGEGGDIYLWAGRGGTAGGTGGDIKIRGGQGMVDGQGGYIRIEGGDSQGAGGGGYITMIGGVGGNSIGGYVQLQGGQGTTGANVTITGGVGTAGPGGAISITGGISANGVSEYGNVLISSGSSTWHFNNSGNLTLPYGGVIIQTPVSYANLTATAGARAFISDANLAAAGNFGQQVIGGASNTVPVWSDGTNWYIG